MRYAWRVEFGPVVAPFFIYLGFLLATFSFQDYFFHRTQFVLSTSIYLIFRSLFSQFRLGYDKLAILPCSLCIPIH